MKRKAGCLVHLILFLMLLTISLPGIVTAAPEQRTALVIGNGAYSFSPLKNPVNDATDLAAALRRAGFTVTLKKNANLQEMVETIEDFGNSLKRGGVGLFYYAGHGVQVNNVNYLLPINARINKESDVRFQAVDAGRILAEMENANNGLNIVILDACRDNPFGMSFRSASRGLAIVANAPSGTFISYSTGAGQVARDGEGRNSPYTNALLENIAKPGLTINKVFMNVRSKVKKETGQVPWELSSLEGDFFFVPGKRNAATAKDESSVSATAVTDDLDDENRKLDAERRRLEEESVSFVKKKTLEEKRQKIAEEREVHALLKDSPKITKDAVFFEERFISNENGWFVVNDNEKRFEIANGKYILESKKGGHWISTRKIPIDQASDFRIDMIVEKMSGTDDYGYGLVWGLKDLQTYYLFVITGNGSFIHESRDNGSEKRIFGRPEKAVNKSNARNNLSLRKSGTTLEFYINSQLVAKTPFMPFFGDWLGCAIYSGNQTITIGFDDIVVSQY